MLCITFDNFGCGSGSLPPCPFPEKIPTLEWDNYNEIGLTLGHPRILHLLKQLNIKTTFFAEGYSAVLHPNEMKKWQDDGHEIGLHAWKHEMWSNLPSDEKEEELVKLGVFAIKDLLGEAPIGFRPPGMRINPWTDDVMERNGIKYIAQITESVKDPRFEKLGIQYPDENQELLISRNKILRCNEKLIDGYLIDPHYGGFFEGVSGEEAYQTFFQLAAAHERSTPEVPWTFIIHPHISCNRAWFGLEKFLRKLHSEFGEGAFKTAKEVVLGA